MGDALTWDYWALTVSVPVGKIQEHPLEYADVGPWEMITVLAEASTEWGDRTDDFDSGCNFIP